MPLKLKFVKGRGCETYNTKEVENEHKEKEKADEETVAAEEGQEALIGLVIHVNNTLQSIFSNVEVYINSQQIYSSIGLHAHKSNIPIDFNKGVISENYGVLHCKGYEKEEVPYEIMEAPLTKLFSTRKMKMLNRRDGSMLYGKLGDDFFSTSELLYPTLRIRLGLIRARPNFYMITDKPNVSLGNVDWSLYTSWIAFKEDLLKKRLDMLGYTPVEFNYMETLAKAFIIAARQNQFTQENIFYNAPVRRIAIARKTNSAFTCSYAESALGINNLISDKLEYSEIVSLL